MTDLQKRIFKIYQEFKKVCERNNLKYYAEGGTKIGATFWHGFIPWDDDMDIVMPLPDYEKLIYECADQFAAPLKIFNGITHPHTDILFAKLHDSSTMFTMDINLPFPDSYTGVFLDINPLIGMPADATTRKNFSKEFIAAAKALHYIKLFDQPGDAAALTEKIQNLIHKYDYATAKFVQPLNSIKNRQLFLRANMENSTEVPFETSTIFNPQNAKQQIKTQYENFQIHPPTTERTGHKGFIDLQKSCTHYAKKFTAEPHTLAAFNRYNHHIRQLRDML